MIVKTLSIFFVISITFCEQRNSQLFDEPWLPEGVKYELDKAKTFYRQDDFPLRVQAAFFRGKCKENGLSNGFVEAEESIRDVRACFRRVRDRKMPDVHSLCDDIQKSTKCYDLLLTGVRPCLTIQGTENWQDARHKLLEFICSTRGQTMSRFMADDGLDCIDEHWEELKECSNGSEELLMSMVPEIVRINITLDEIQERQCSEFMALKDCLMTTLRRHCLPTIVEIANSVLDILIGGAACEDLIFTQTMELAADLELNEISPDDLVV